MAAAAQSPVGARPMRVSERAAFCVVPLGALCAVAWVLLGTELPWVWSIDWVPALGVDLAFRIDGLAALLLLMITGVGSAVFVYAGGYLAGHPQQRRLFVLLLAFMGAMIGCVTADHLILLFVFWELTSFLSFLLVGFDHENARSRTSAQQALLVTGSGGLALLAGLLVLWQAMGTGSIDEIVRRLPDATPSPSLNTALVLILAGSFTKSAQFPFHFWLPNAMTAPTPVSAYLHSATMVKLGVYLLARLDPGFGEWPLWEWALKGAGSITAAWGMVLALRERDLKRILAWSTVATLGTLVTLVGLRGEGASVAVGALLLAHALYKAPLFFVAGNIDHATGTRVIDRLGNLRHAMPWTAAAALLAGMSMAGIPLSFGYLVKDAIREAKSSGDVFLFAKLANTMFAAVAVAVAGVAAVRVFWRHPGTNETPDAHEGGPALVMPPLALAVSGIVLGSFPFLIQDLIVDASVAMTTGHSQAAGGDLALDLGPTLGSLAGTLGVGALVFLFWDALHARIDRLARRIDRVGMSAHYERALEGIPWLAATSTRLLQHGSLPGYGMLVVGSALLCIGAAVLYGDANLRVSLGESPPSAGAIGACALIVSGSALASVLRDRFVLLIATGLVGYGSAVLFLFVGAPDVALTQFTAETVFVIVVGSVLLGLRRLGRARSVPEPVLRPAALALAAGFATLLTWLLLAVSSTPLDPALSRYFAEQSVPAAHGRNVVNVILVDFRALDTLGEITVVLLSLLAASSVLRAIRMQRGDAGGSAR